MLKILSENKKTPNKKVEKIISQTQTVDKVSDYSILCLFFLVKWRKGADLDVEKTRYE
ncbi:hypothetical protein [Viridibacillus arvi]|uniref:hypothetical protein n=1 Tax=Viridibacillus arvi TaxID=263475 RepID=UPI00146FE9C5|nr:hypothetical protein [Viridibacillus arvi]